MGMRTEFIIFVALGVALAALIEGSIALLTFL
jgi:hypothetical protein